MNAILPGCVGSTNDHRTRLAWTLNGREECTGANKGSYFRLIQQRAQTQRNKATITCFLPAGLSKRCEATTDTTHASARDSERGRWTECLYDFAT